MAKTTRYVVVKYLCLFGLLIQQVLGWVRVALNYTISQNHKHNLSQEMDMYLDIFYWISYVFFPAIGVVFLPLQVFFLLKDVRDDLFLFKHWFTRVYTIFTLHIWICMYGIIGHMTMFYVVTADRDAEAVRYIMDVVDGLIGCFTLLCFTFILFRPLLPCFRDTTDHRNEMLSPLREKDSLDDDSNSCNKNIALVFYAIFYILYILSFLAMLFFLGYSLHCKLGNGDGGLCSLAVTKD